MSADADKLVAESLHAAYRGDARRALQLAERAVAADPELGAAHRARALALADLGRRAPADEAFRRALELDPDDPELMLDAAEFFATAPGAEGEELVEALELASGAREIFEDEGDRALAAECLLIEAICHNALGDAQAAYDALDETPREVRDRPEARAEEALALFELGRWADARDAAGRYLEAAPKDAWAHHLLGLNLERVDTAQAEPHFARARALDPDAFPPPVKLAPDEFDAAIREAVAELPAEIRAHVDAALVSVKELPADADLREYEADHPLSPQSLGMFRGASLRDTDRSGELPPQIFLFQRNLERAARTRDELVEQIRITVLHEVGHLLGLDEHDLHERGLQ